MIQLGKIALPTLLLFLLSACDSRTNDCRKLINNWESLLINMKKSGRFSESFIKKHEAQFNMINLLAHRFNSKKTKEESSAECREHAAIIEPQLKLSKMLNSLSRNNLEARFCPPLGISGNNGCLPKQAR